MLSVYKLYLQPLYNSNNDNDNNRNNNNIKQEEYFWLKVFRAVD